jgi:hypothetical protein
MGSSHGEFVKYPRTPHLFGSRGTDDDRHMGEAESLRFVTDKSLIVEEKIDGTNVGIHFTKAQDGFRGGGTRGPRNRYNRPDPSGLSSARPPSAPGIRGVDRW